MSAALTELRPVEIVGLYEDVIEDFQVPCPIDVLVYVTGTTCVHTVQKGNKALLRTGNVTPMPDLK